MGFEEKVAQLSDKVRNLKDDIKTEEATKKCVYYAIYWQCSWV